MTDPYKDINFVKRRALIQSKDGEVIYDKEVIFPDYFSDTAVNITASKYFHKSIDNEEIDIRDMFNRVSNCIGNWGFDQSYFSGEERNEFKNKLKNFQIRQLFAFNSPIYFNCGIAAKVQASACFILKIDDNMESITNTACIESKIFKKGSGSGMNLSNLRSKYENINNQTGYASGAVSFLKVHDLQASIIKSGGSLRRSAKLACLNMDHPDIEDFIDCKKFEEEKLNALKAAGIKPRPGCELSDEVFFQSTNISVRPSDKFMDRVIDNGTWDTKYVTTGQVHKTYNARELLYRVAQRTWEMGDPGIQFDDTVNEWNTVSNDGRIRSGNPCNEFLFLDNSSCNLAVLNLIKFFDKTEFGYTFNFDLFKDVIETVITAQDIVVDGAVYPTEEITNNSKKYRPLGLGYTNLGALLMLLGLPYDSDEGRQFASYITALMTGIAYQTSSLLADKLGDFDRFKDNKEPFYKVLFKHADKVSELHNTFIVKSPQSDILRNMQQVWKNICDLVNSNAPFRNAQVTLLMPSGTTSFLLDAQTTGIEPEYSHVKYKRLSNTDDGVIKITSDITKKCLENLGYCDKDISEIECYITDDKSLDLCRRLKKEHKNILDTSTNIHSDQTIHYSGHIKMLAAVQPFISGGISKTVSFPNDCTVEDIFKCYVESWKLGLKGVAIYRDGSKSYQPLSNKVGTVEDSNDGIELDEIEEDLVESIRSGEYPRDDKLIKYMHSILAQKKLPDERPALNHKFSVDQVKGYLNLGMFADGSLGEVFITISKEGSTLSGLLDCLGTLTSISLQRGVPLKDIVEKMIWQQFLPSGWTSNSQIRTATSIVDYIFKYIGMKFLSKEDQLELGLIKEDEMGTDFENEYKPVVKPYKKSTGGGKICNICSHLMVLKGSCYTCVNCAANTGACG